MKRWIVTLGVVLLCLGLAVGGWALYENREPDEGLLMEIVIRDGDAQEYKNYCAVGAWTWYENQELDERLRQKITTKDGIVRQYKNYYAFSQEKQTAAEDLMWDREGETKLTVSQIYSEGPTELEVEVFCRTPQASNWTSCGKATLAVGGEGASFIIPAHNVYRVEAIPVQGKNGYAHIWCELESLS